jgi:GT2 family glycosyltransferase
MDVSIIIVNYNTGKLILNLLASIRKYVSDITYEIIVVDNNSSENISELLMPYQNEVRCILLPENVGFGRANNKALEYATGRYIFFLNPDTLLLNNAVKILSDFMDNNPKVGVCGGNLYDEKMCPIHSFMPILPSPLWDLNTLLGEQLFKLRYGKNIQHNYTDHPIQVGYVTGADMLVRREVLDQVGAFDPDFFMYFEETELTHRIVKAGWKVYAVPDAKIIHLEGQSFETSDRRQQMVSKSKKIYYQKTSIMFAYHVAKVFFTLAALMRIGVFTLIGNQQKRAYWATIYKNI